MGVCCFLSCITVDMFCLCIGLVCLFGVFFAIGLKFFLVSEVFQFFVSKFG